MEPTGANAEPNPSPPDTHAHDDASDATSQRILTRGVAWTLAASGAYALMGALTKVGMQEAGVLEVIFWRSAVIVAIIGVLARARGVSWRPQGWALLSARTALGLVAMVCFYESIDRVPLGTATVLLYTSPIVTALLSGWLLRERKPPGLLPLVALAFVGVVLIVRPEELVWQWGMGLGLASGLLASLSYMCVRALRKTDPPERIVGVFALACAVVTAPWALSGEAELWSRGWTSWAAVLGVGGAACAGQLLLTWALKVERANVVGMLSYATVVLSYGAGLIFWGETPSWLGALGVACVVGAGAALSALRGSESPNDDAQPADDTPR